jgi:hypothetical protein
MMERSNRNVWIIVIVVLVILCCCVAVAAAAAIGLFTSWSFSFDRDWDWDWDLGRETERIEESFDVGATPRLEIDSFAGNVTVRAGEANTIRVVATKKASNRSNLDRIEIDWHEQDDGLRIETSHSRRTASNMSVELEITAPAGSRLELDSGAGNIQVEDIAGEMDVHTGAGNVDVQRAEGRVSLDTGAGNITYDGTPQGNCRVETGAGNITLKLPAEVDVEVELDTGIGNVDVSGFDVDGEVSRGEVDGIIGSDPQSRIEAHTGAGNIDLVRR